RDDRCRPLCRISRRIAVRDNNIDLEPDELGRELGGALVAALRPAIREREVATLNPAEFAQPLHQHGVPLAVRCRRARDKASDGYQFPELLRLRRERPRGCCAAKQCDEFSPPHSITSSAMESMLDGMTSPSALAVFRLI